MGKGRRRRRNKRALTMWGLIFLGFALGAATVVFLVRFPDIFRPAVKEADRVAEAPPVRRPGPSPEAPPEGPREGAPVEAPTEAPQEKPPQVPVKPAKPAARVAIIIDDMGQDLKRLREISDIETSITIAVIPNLPHSTETATEAHSKGIEVIVHMPMEPRDLTDHDPGDGALMTAMEEKALKESLEKGLEAVPFAVGLNNHMGSRFTEDERGMRAVLEVMKKKDMFFLDSRTTDKSVAVRLAGEIGVKKAGRNVFLDNERDNGYIKGQLKELVRIARKRGKAVGIGHPYPETIEALREFLPALEGNGVRVVKLSELVE